jgi:hypothetical protein
MHRACGILLVLVLAGVVVQAVRFVGVTSWFPKGTRTLWTRLDLSQRGV